MNAPLAPATRVWPAEGLTRVPYWIYQDPDIYALEQERIFRGATWTFLGLAAEVPNAGDWKTTFVGDMPVVVARDATGALHAFENRCAHRGALLCLKSHGNSREIACIYHNWTYDLAGNLTGGQVAHESHLSCQTKPTVHRAANLRRYAKGLA